MTLSRLESRETPVADETVDVRQLVREVADEARALSLGRHQIDVDLTPGLVLGSREELRSAFGEHRFQRSALHTRWRGHFARVARRRERWAL